MHVFVKSLRYFLVVASLSTLAVACADPFSARSYRDHDGDQAHATICHQNKRTINVPAEEWQAHRDHGDYRGPCRPRGVPLAGKEPSPKHTDVDYGNRKARKAWSEEEWARHQATKATDAAAKELTPD